MKVITVAHLLLFCLSVLSQNLEKSRSVWIEQGLVRGKIYKIGDHQVQIFRGIPYAGQFLENPSKLFCWEPPIGELRFAVSFYVGIQPDAYAFPEAG